MRIIKSELHIFFYSSLFNAFHEKSRVVLLMKTSPIWAILVCYEKTVALCSDFFPSSIYDDYETLKDSTHVFK